MLRIRVSRTLLGFLLSFVAVGTAAAAAPSSLGWPMVIGHRGMGADHAPEPENSMSALLGAFIQGASAVEFDVQLTRDNQVVLAHDPDLERMTNGDGCVAEKTLPALKRLSLKNGAGKVLRGVQIATMEEALLAISIFDRPDRPFLADIHIKVYDGLHGDVAGWGNLTCDTTRYRVLTDQVLATVTRMGLLDRVIFTSFDLRVLNRIKRSHPQARVGALTLTSPLDTILYARGRYEFVALNHLNYTGFEVMVAHAYGLRVLAWSPEDRDEMEPVFSDGIDGVIADNVPIATRLRRDRVGTLSRAHGHPL